MSMKVLIISTSLRTNSNSDILARKCVRGALDAGHEVEYVSLKGKRIEYCIGCLSCIKSGRCVLKDDVKDIMEKVKQAEVIIFATPIYYYEMCGQMKTLLDRLNPLYASEYTFRDIYMIATAAENEESAFEKATLKGIVKGAGISDASDALNHKDVLKSAYELGRNL